MEQPKVSRRGRRPGSKNKTKFVLASSVNSRDHISDSCLAEKINKRFMILDKMAAATINGFNRALIISGPPGLGKSFSIEKMLEKNPNIKYETIKGFVRSTGLYKALYNTRERGSVLIFDDADSILMDDVSLNLLKAALDTTESRYISWRAETRMEDEEGEKLPTCFLFEGQVIFITNIDFDATIEKSPRLGPHLAAILSRSHYLDLDIKTKREYIIRIKQVVNNGMLSKKGITLHQEIAILNFIERYADNLRELSLRMVMKIADMVIMDPNDWEELAKITVLKRS